MTIEETTKLLCILAGYDNNFSFETWFDGTCKGYDIYAEDDDENCINVSAAMGSIDLFKTLLDEIKKSPHHHPPYWVNEIPYKVLLDDEYRKIRKEEDMEYEKYCREISKLEIPYHNWIAKNNPCPNCKINKKDHWDDIHYNCEDCHTMSCPILKKFHENRDKKFKEITDTTEFKKVKDEYQQKKDYLQQKSIEIYEKIQKK